MSGRSFFQVAPFLRYEASKLMTKQNMMRLGQDGRVNSSSAVERIKLLRKSHYVLKRRMIKHKRYTK